jgi:hypothetical protein
VELSVFFVFPIELKIPKLVRVLEQLHELVESLASLQSFHVYLQFCHNLNEGVGGVHEGFDQLIEGVL